MSSLPSCWAHVWLPALLLVTGVSVPGMAPAQANRRIPPAGMSLSVDALTRLATFWTAFAHEPDSVRTPRLGTFDTPTPFVEIDTVYSGSRIDRTEVTLNLTTLAATDPAVAADLRRAGLTPARYHAIFATLLTACRTYNAARSGNPRPPTLAEAINIAMLTAHPQLFNRLFSSAATHLLGLGDCQDMARALAGRA